MSEEEITKLLDLARLELSNHEISGLAQQFGDMLQFVGQVNSAAQNLEQKPMILKDSIAFRDDIISQTRICSSEFISARQKDSRRDFIVPRIVGGEARDE